MSGSSACYLCTTLPQPRGYADFRVGMLRSNADSKHLRRVCSFQSFSSALQHRTNPSRTSHQCRAWSHSKGQSTATSNRLPPTVNWHLEPRCNYGCKFCFATFEDVKQHLQSKVVQGSSNGRADQLLLVPQLLKAAGANKINFVGGEPFLHPLIFQLIEAAKRAGLVTSVVTNGSCLDPSKLLRLQGHLDWLAFSVDASTDHLHAAMGRGLPRELQQQPGGTSDSGPAPAAAAASRPDGHLARVLPLWQMARELGFRLKLNTVVSRINLHDDMAPLVLQLAPERWKIFQVMPVEGQNDGRVEPLLIQQHEFQAWVARHEPSVAAVGIPLVPETNEDMMGSYAMLDADCRFYTNAAGHYQYGPSIFDAADGVLEAWSSVTAAGPAFSASAFLDRGGLYDWGQGQEVMQAALLQLGGAGKSPAQGQGPQGVIWQLIVSDVETAD